MATLTPSLETGTDWLNSIRTRLNAGGAGNPATIDIYTGTKPARPNTAITSQVKLGTVTCADDCGTVATLNDIPTLTFASIAADSAADETGVATWARAKSGEATPAPVIDFDISTVGGSGFGQMNTTNVVKDGPITAPSVVITA